VQYKSTDEYVCKVVSFEGNGPLPFPDEQLMKEYAGVTASQEY